MGLNETTYSECRWRREEDPNPSPGARQHVDVKVMRNEQRRLSRSEQGAGGGIRENSGSVAESRTYFKEFTSNGYS